MEIDDFKKKLGDKNKVYLVDFFATWCGPCQMMTPVIEELEKEFDGKPVEFVKIDIDENPEIPADYSVMSVPTFLIIKEEKVISQFVGAVPKDSLTEKINEALK